MAAQTTDRLWSSTHVLGAYHGQGPAAAAAPETRDAGRCRCCPYGYHIDVDFLNYLNAIKAGSGLSKLKKIHGHRLRQRQAMETQLLMIQRPTSTPPPGGRPGFDSGGTDLSESSGSSSPVTPWSPSEDERDTASATVAAASRHLMADLDASIADALDSIEALMQPQRTRTTANTMTTGTAAAGSRSVSTGDVHRFSGGVDGQTSTSITTTQVLQGPPSPQASVSLSSLQEDNKHAANLTSDVFMPSSTQQFRVDSRRASDDSNSQSSSAVEHHRQTKTVGVSSTVVMTTVLHESLPSPAASTPPGKSYVPRPPVKPRKATSVGVSEERAHEDLARETRPTDAFSLRMTADAGTDAQYQLPAVPYSTGEVEPTRDPAVCERQTTQHSIISDFTTDVQTTTSVSVSATTTSSTNASSFRRQLPVPPKPTEPETSLTTTSKGSSFSSVRALLNRKSGGAQRADAARVDRPVRRTRHQVSKTAQTNTTSDDVVSEPVLLLSNKTALASDHSTTATKHLIQSRENDSSGTLTTSTSGTITQAESKESITTSSCSSPADIDDIEVAQPKSFIAPSSFSYDQVDHEGMEVSVDALAKAMAILSPIVERPRHGSDTTLDQAEVSSPPAVNPEVLMTIRKYIASSLQQMQMLEQQVKLVPMLQLRVSVLKEEKRLLKLQLTKNSSSAKSSQADACVGVTLSELPVAGKESDLSSKLERSNLPVPVERQDIGVGDSRVDINSDSALFCPSCKTALRSSQSPSLRTTLELSKHEVETACVQKPESESESVGHQSVSAFVSKLQGHDTNHPPSPTRRFRSVEKAVRVSVTSAKDDDEVFTTAVSPRSPDAESSAFTAVRRPRPPVPLKQISIRREEGTNQTTVGVQCTLLKDTAEVHQVREAFPPDLDPSNKRMERPEFRAHEPDLVTTHCFGGLSQIEHHLRLDAAYSLKTFADKETETDGTLQHSAAVNTDSLTVVETSSKLYPVDTKVPAQMMDCSVNTDISGDICSTGEYLTSTSTRTERSTVPENAYTRSDVRLEPNVYERTGQQTTVSNFTDTTHVSESTSEDAALKLEVMQSVSVATVSPDIVSKNTIHSVKDASCSADIVTKPITTDASSCTDESLICPLSFDASKLKYSAEVKPFVKDPECSADITIKPLVATTACNTDSSMDQLHEIGCNTTDEYRNNMVDTACGDDSVNVPVPDVISVGCNTEVKSKRDFGCCTIEEKQPMKDVSCSAVIKLSVCDKSCTAVPVSDVGKTVGADEGPAGGQLGETVTSKDVACLTDSLTTCEMSSNTEDMTASSRAASVEIASGVVPTGVRLSYVETGCVTDILWKPPTKEAGCGTDDSVSSTEATSLTSVVAADVSVTKPAPVTVALNTDAWLLTSDLTFLDTLKEVIRPSVTETASMTDSIERVPTADTSTNTARQNTVECSTNTDAEIKPLFVSVETLARPAACDVSCNTEAEDKRLEVRDVASSTDIVLRPSVSDASVNTDAEAERFSGKPSHSVASNTDTTIHPCAVETASLVTSAPGVTDDIPNLKDASSATDSLSVCHVSVGTEATSKPLSVDTAAQTQTEPSTFTASELWSETVDERLSYGAETVRQQDKEVTAKVDTTDVACIVALRPPLRSVACGIDAEVISHDSFSESVSDSADLHLVSIENDIPSEIRQSENSADLRDAEAPVFPETREIACNTESILLSSLFDSSLRLFVDTSELKDVHTSAASWTNGEEGANVCRLCGVQSSPKPSAASVTDISPELISRHRTEIVAERRWTEERCEEDSVYGQLRAKETSDAEKTDLADVTVDDIMVKARQEVERKTKDTGCDAGRILTMDMAINTDLTIDLLAAEQDRDRTSESDNKQVFGSESHHNAVHSLSTQDATAVSTRIAIDVACGTSDVISPTYEDVCHADNASFQENVVVAASVMADSVTKCPTCLARRPTRDSSCETDSSSSLLDDLTGQSATGHVECAIPSKTVCEVGCNTDSCQMIPSTADAACNTDSATPTDAPIDVTRKPTRIPHKLATTTRRPDAHVAKPDMTDAVCITDIAIAPLDDDEVLKKSDDRERSRAVPSTAEVACNTDGIDNIDTSVSVGVDKPRPLRPSVRTVGCSTDPTSADTKPSTRDAGCTARPQTKAQSCVTDPMPSQPITETPVKAVERTRTGLQVTRVKSQTVSTARFANTLTPPPTTSDAPALAAAKSPTFDVACGTDLEFHSKYFNMDDGGLLHQLSADDMAEVLLLRRPPSLSLTSPTCDVACNTEYDSRPCTPARVNYSGYFASAATDPPPPTAADVACGPDTPSAALCDVGCGTEDLLSATPFQTSSDVNTAQPTTHVDIRSKLGTDSRGTTLPVSSTDHRQRLLPSPPTAEKEQGKPPEMVNATAESEHLRSSQRQSYDTHDLPSTISQQQFVLEMSATSEGVVGRQMTQTQSEVDLSLLQKVNLIQGYRR